jgi:hypothetical protein
MCAYLLAADDADGINAYFKLIKLTHNKLAHLLTTAPWMMRCIPLIPN